MLNADGSATETFADTNGSLNSSPDGKTDSTTAVTATSANGLTKTVVTTGMNDDYSDSNTLTDSKVINADGSAAETIAVTVPGSNGASVARDTETVNTSANGLSQTTQLSAGGTTIYSAAATTGLDGSKTSTVSALQSGRNALRRGCNHHQRQRPVGFPAKRAQRLQHLQPFRDDRHKHGRQRYRYGLGYQFERRYHGRNRHHGERQWAQQERRDRARWRRAAEQFLSDVTTLNADGSTTLVQSVLNANGSLRSQDIKTTSADGLNITTAYDLTGDGMVDETTTDNTVLNADGSKTETVTTTYANGTEKSQSVTTTSANGLDVTTAQDIVGYATITDTVAVSSSGAKTETAGYYDTSGSLASKTVTTTSADGRDTVVDHENSSGTITSTETTLVTAGANGSYQWTDVSASGTVLDEANHFIDANGADSVTLYVGSTEYTATLSVAQEASELAVVDRLYSTLLGRAPTVSRVANLASILHVERVECDGAGQQHPVFDGILRKNMAH